MAKRKKTEVVEQVTEVVGGEPTPDLEKLASEDPQVIAIIQRYKDTAARWNSIAAYLTGQSKIDPRITPEQHVSFLANAYYHDVLFLLDQLGVVKEPQAADQVAVEQQETVVEEK